MTILSPNSRNANGALDAAIAAVRAQDLPDSPDITAAADRVWARLADEAATGASTPAALAGQEAGKHHSRIRGCADVQALLPSFLAGTLAPARALLVEDHSRECIPCRKALLALRAGSPAVRSKAAPARGRWSQMARPALLAAGLAGVVGLGALLWQTLAPGGAAAQVASLDGSLYRVAEGGSALQPVAVNEEISAGEVLRTGRGGGAVLTLADGSRVEMRERSELAISTRRDGATVQLLRGDVIVEAAKQRPKRHLGVSTDDCVVSVVGTVFTVSSGTKGSRVGVLEGEVRVARGRETNTLHPGDQIATHASLRRITLAEEVAWSRDSERHLESVRALAGLGQDLGNALDRAVAASNLYYSTTLLDLMPAHTMVYVALPNLSDTLGEAEEILRQRLGENPALQAWWQENVAATGADRQLATAIEHLRRVGSFLGAEIAVGLPAKADTEPDSHGVGEPLLLAEVSRPNGFDSVLRDEVARINSEAGNDGHLRLIADPSREPIAGDDQRHELLLWLDNDLLAAAPAVSQLRKVQAIRGGQGNAFVGSAFHQRLTQVYGEGAGWLLAADLEQVLAHAADSDHDRLGLEAAGISDARFAIVERKEADGLTETRLALSFSGPRRGVASWLAAPAPMGSLDFVSPEANLYAGFLAKAPAGMVDDLFAILTAADPSARARLAEIEAREGFDLRADLAAPLGGEIAFALDGPYLPTPSWKLIVEVYDAARLQSAVERMAEHIRAAHAGSADAAPGEWTITRSNEGDREFFTLTAGTMEIHYLYEGGYLLAAPSQALLVRAVQFRETGFSLSGSERFTALLPHDRENNFSALVFQDLGGAVGPLMGLIGGQANLPAEQQSAIQAMAAEAPATLLYAYGEEDSILAGCRGSGPWASSLGSLLGIASSLKRLHAAPRTDGDSDGDAHDATAVTKPAAAPAQSVALGAHNAARETARAVVRNTRSAARGAWRAAHRAAHSVVDQSTSAQSPTSSAKPARANRVV